MTRWLAVLLLTAACGGAPQKEDETAVTYRAKFKAEPGVTAKVVFPFPADNGQSQVEQGLALDGTKGRLIVTNEGQGLELSGQGEAEVQWSGVVKVLGKGDAVPEAQLSRQVPDANTTERYFQVNKGGSALINIEFEYSATRDCGGDCGGSRSWKYAGPVGLSIQQVSVEFTESTR